MANNVFILYYLMLIYIPYGSIATWHKDLHLEIKYKKQKKAAQSSALLEHYIHGRTNAPDIDPLTLQSSSSRCPYHGIGIWWQCEG